MSEKPKDIANVKINNMYYIVSIYWVCHKKELIRDKGTLYHKVRKQLVEYKKVIYSYHVPETVK